MRISDVQRRNTCWIAAIIALLLVIASCGIKPYEPRNNREEGPQQGLFTGPQGEWVIYQRVEEPESDGEEKKRPDETTEAEQKDSSGKPEQSLDETKDNEQP